MIIAENYRMKYLPRDFIKVLPFICPEFKKIKKYGLCKGCLPHIHIYSNPIIFDVKFEWRGEAVYWKLYNTIFMRKFDTNILFHEMIHWVQQRTLGDDYKKRYPKGGDEFYILEEQAYRYENLASELNIQWKLKFKGYVEEDDSEFEKRVMEYYIRLGMATKI